MVIYSVSERIYLGLEGCNSLLEPNHKDTGGSESSYPEDIKGFIKAHNQICRRSRAAELDLSFYKVVKRCRGALNRHFRVPLKI